MPEVLILTGPPGAGKSTVAQALAERYDRVAHIQTDVLRHFITPTGYIAPGRPGFERQQRLGIHNACALAANFLAERIAVIVDDIVVNQADLAAYVEGVKLAQVPVHYVRLLPSLEVCQARNRERAAQRVAPGRVQTVHAQFVAAGEIGGSTIDSSALTAYETADKLQALTTSGASIVSQSQAASD
ncbi:MAG TPA: AAA family ATPase [Dehalococcoidia bacterium]|nr:AAA family ATPase [Dehalococcoidia bacterium]